MTSTATGIFSIDANDTTFGFLLGLGFNYDITETIFLGLEGKYFWANPRFDTLGSPDIDGILATASLGFRF
jgi:opacity protein-like surface antigen